MSLFDFIENKQNTPEPAASGHKITGVKASCYTQKTKPEKLKFLKPCPLCEGRDFVCTKTGGFFCIQCKPGAIGTPVIAEGSWDLPGTSSSSELEPDNNQEDSKEESRPTQMDIHGLYFKAAFPWIMNHLAELQKVGWTRPTLFRRGKYKWPIGNWGIAWMNIWNKSNLEIQIRPNGTLAFTFSSSGKRIIQTAAPNNIHNKKTKRSVDNETVN